MSENTTWWMNVKSLCQGLSKETQKPLLTAKNKPKQTASHILPSEIYAVCFCDLLLVLIRCSVSLPVNSHFTVSTLSVLSLSSLRISQLNLTEKKHGFSLSFFSWLYFLCCQPHCHRRDFLSLSADLHTVLSEWTWWGQISTGVEVTLLFLLLLCL